MSNEDIKDLDVWVKELSDANIPILKNSFDAILKAAGNSKSSSKQVTDTILKDAALTLQVLRIANSDSGEKVNTITAAVDKIGVDGVLGLCVSVMRVDSLGNRPQRAHLEERLVCAYHSAVQTKNIIPLLNCESTEESFVASLILHMGEICFWSRLCPQSERFHDLMQKDQLDSLKIEEDVLGTEFREISKGLAQTWHLDGIVANALSAPINPPPLVNAIIIGDEVSASVANKGWQSSECTDAVSKLCTAAGVGLNKAKEVLKSSCNDAIEELSTFGVSNVAELIPEA